MARADDEINEAIKGLEDAGAAVNAEKPSKSVKPIRAVKKMENPNAGEASFVEEDSLKDPFGIPVEEETTLAGLEEALTDCVYDTSTTQTADDTVDTCISDDDATKSMLIRKFAQKTRSIYTVSPNTPSERNYATQSVWNYVLALNNCHVRVVEITESNRGNSDSFAIETDVYCRAELVDNQTDKVLTTTTMCASTDESWVSGQKNKLSVVYALAQTRAAERLARMIFGYQVALAGLRPTPAEELDVVEKWWGTKDKEL